MGTTSRRGRSTVEQKDGYLVAMLTALLWEHGDSMVRIAWDIVNCGEWGGKRV